MNPRDLINDLIEQGIKVRDIAHCLDVSIHRINLWHIGGRISFTEWENLTELYNHPSDIAELTIKNKKNPEQVIGVGYSVLELLGAYHNK